MLGEAGSSKKGSSRCDCRGVELGTGRVQARLVALLRHRACLMATNREGIMPLHSPASRGRPAVLHVLLEHRAQLGPCSSWRLNPLLVLAVNLASLFTSGVATLRLLLDGSADSATFRHEVRQCYALLLFMGLQHRLGRRGRSRCIR